MLLGADLYGTVVSRESDFGTDAEPIRIQWQCTPEQICFESNCNTNSVRTVVPGRGSAVLMLPRAQLGVLSSYLGRRI